MKYGIKFVLLCLLIIGFSHAQSPRFDPDKDLLLAQFDCKTDVDDLHTVAALSTLLSHPDLGISNTMQWPGPMGYKKGRMYPQRNFLNSLLVPTGPMPMEIIKKH